MVVNEFPGLVLCVFGSCDSIIVLLLLCIGLWSLHCGSGGEGGDALDNTLLVSFVGHTT